MSLQINGSNSLEHLALQLSKELYKQQNHVFQPQFIVTQTLGMNNWLKVKVAEHLGIVANCKFLKPNELVNEIYYKLGANNKQALSPGVLQWVLFTLLATKDFQDRFRKIANYYIDDDVKRLALAEKVSDLFDQYQVYRVELISEWNENDSEFDPNNGWQKYLWVKATEILGESMPDKTIVGKHIIASLSHPEQQKKIAVQVPNIHVFGLSIITRYHVHIFYELAKVINVSFHILNPAPLVYWFDDKSEKQIAKWRSKSTPKMPKPELESMGNPLLTGWGNVLQETFSMLFENDTFLNQYDDLNAEEPEPGTLLGKIQNDIFHNSDNKGRNKITEKDVTDGSITINACYTTAREVEVLYNYLVHLVDQKREVLAARDVVVMVSDIDAYAPYIKAIFNSATYKVPFTIADESFVITDNLFSALQSVLALTDENFKAEDVLQLLDSKFIRTRFSITDTELVRRAVNTANIRFGIEGRMEDDTIYVSWKNGLRRIVLGICMSGGEEYNAGSYSTYPLDIVEGEDSFELIRFCHFAEVLISTIEERRNYRTISEWGEYIEQVVDKLICQAEDNSDEDYQLLSKRLEKLYVLNDIVKDKVSFEVFKHSFVNSLSAESLSSGFASGGITFCSLIPMRSIPFKVVALLGLDFDKFPRKETRVSFNIIEQERKKGDRNVKENDKHLFLETILSAQKYLYISYKGRSAKDNTHQPPSVLVDELLDYIQTGIDDEKLKVKEALVTAHPLHGFSQKYFQKDSKLYNYLGEPETKVEDKKMADNSTIEQLTFAEISIDTLIAFFKNPFKAYYNTILGIRYEQDEVLLPENELFEMDGLQSWQLKQDLLFLEKDELEAYRNKGVATGILPLKNMADFVLTNTKTAVEPLKELVTECKKNAEETFLNIELLADSSLIKGKLNRIYDDRLVFISFSKGECKYLLEAYIRWLIATASGAYVELNFISAERNSVYKIQHNTLSRNAALKALTKLVRIYKEGHESILMFFPDFDKSPWEIAGLTREKFNNLVKKYLEGDYADPYLKKEQSYGYFEQEEIYEQYLENCEAIFSDPGGLFQSYYSGK